MLGWLHTWSTVTVQHTQLGVTEGVISMRCGGNTVQSHPRNVVRRDHPLTRRNPDHQKTGNLVLRTAQGTEATRSMASTTSVPASCIRGGSRTLHLQCSPQIKGRARRKSCQMKIQHPLIQDSMLHGSFVTTSTLHNDCKMHTRKAYEFHGNSATVNHPWQNSNDCRHLHTAHYRLHTLQPQCRFINDL